jgi:hypothetical protein
MSTKKSKPAIPKLGSRGIAKDYQRLGLSHIKYKGPRSLYERKEAD